ncbi:MAG: alpha/beta hydrolase [Myxococcota bacterium]|nr:alpha/beta hydrolase [Myxococcales bacterium]
MPKYAYDPEYLPFLDALPTISDLADPQGIVEGRATRAAMMGQATDPLPGVARRDVAVPGRDGDPDVPVRVYAPAAAASAPRAAVVEIHGGGFLFGNVDMMDAWCDAVALQHDAVVVSVEYRLAPEHPYPAGVEDCLAALRWTAANAAGLGVDPARIAVAGQSAGGGLAAATALLARDRGGPALCFQLLEIPELDDRLETPSMKAFTDTPLWNRPNAIWSWRHYLGPLLGGDVPPYAAPARATDLAGLPPAYVSVMEFDPLRDEGIDYAARMLQAGVSVELHAFPGTFHGSGLITTAEISKRVSAESFAALGRALARR